MNTNQIGQRVLSIRKKKNLTQEEFSKLTGVTRSYLAVIEKGAKKPSFNCVISILDATKVNADWLLTGNGPMYLPSKKTGETREINEGVTSYGVAAAPVDLKQNWGKLNDRQKREITERVEEMVEVNVLKEFVTKFATQSGQILPAKSSATL